MSRSVKQDYETIRENQARAQEALVSVCEVCGVDHATGSADLSHGIVRLMEHAKEQTPWMEWPISGDKVAFQRSGQVGTSLLFSVDWDAL